VKIVRKPEWKRGDISGLDWTNTLTGPQRSEPSVPNWRLKSSKKPSNFLWPFLCVCGGVDSSCVRRNAMQWNKAWST
jgi:hypothetical protein